MGKQQNEGKGKKAKDVSKKPRRSADEVQSRARIGKKHGKRGPRTTSSKCKGRQRHSTTPRHRLKTSTSLLLDGGFVREHMALRVRLHLTAKRLHDPKPIPFCLLVFPRETAARGFDRIHLTIGVWLAGCLENEKCGVVLPMGPISSCPLFLLFAIAIGNCLIR